jgi:hypothetical protein
MASQMAGNSTIDVKPVGLHLHEARSCALTTPNHLSNQENHFPMNCGYPSPYMMPHMPPFYYPPGQGLPGNSYPFPAYPSPAAMLPNPNPIIPQVRKSSGSIEYPYIICWFHFLDKHKEHSKDGIIFSPFSAVLKDKGFLWIMQLTLEFFTLKDLQEWLDIEIGTAVLIMQYAKEDVDAIQAGTLVIPKE